MDGIDRKSADNAELAELETTAAIGGGTLEVTMEEAEVLNKFEAAILSEPGGTEDPGGGTLISGKIVLRLKLT